MNSSDPPVAGHNPQPPVGIDLGTTYSVVAYLDDMGRPSTVVNALGDILTPSAVAFDEEGVIVGKEAVKGSVFAPDLFADCFKRDMGRPNFRHAVRGKEVPPEVLNGFLLQRLKDDAQRRLGPIRQVVITVPAFFDETRRKATQDAGQLAGLEVLDIINEPTAAALAFGYHRRHLPQRPDAEDAAATAAAVEVAEAAIRVLVYDLGGGTFDVTILEIAGRRFRTLATDGDVQLGGKDFDERLVNYVAEKFIEAHGIDPRGHPQDAAQLWLDAQEAKHALTERSKTNVACVHAGIRMRVEITRTLFEDLTRDLLERTESTTVLVMKQAGLEWAAIDRVLLVGGSTRMPMVGEMLCRLSGRLPDRSQSADEVVAHGAALYAGMLMSGADAAPEKQFQLVNVNSHSLGLVGIDPKTGRRVNAILIPKNTSLPCRKSKRFQTARANQNTVEISAVEGESRRPEHCIPLGKCVIRGLPPGLPKGTSVEVEYRYASNGRISISARVPTVRQSATLEIQHEQARNLMDLEHWRKKLCGTVAEMAQAALAKHALQDGRAPLEPAQRAALIKRLDEFCIRAGRAAIQAHLPAHLEKSRQAARAAEQESTRAAAELRRAEEARQAAVSQSEIAQATAEVSQARMAQQRAETNVRFAQLVFGRECLVAEVVPPELWPHLEEIRQLQTRLNTATA
jgi:molecular chaperone DnaK